MFKYKAFFSLLIIIFIVCKITIPKVSSEDKNPTIPLSHKLKEIAVKNISLEGPITMRSSEVSGLAWYGDYLILLPQYPDFTPSKTDGFLFALHKTNILAFLDGNETSLRPLQIPFFAPGFRRGRNNYEGFEAVAFVGNRIYLTVETKPGRMLGLLIAGRIEPDLSKIILDTENLTDIPPQTDINNMTEEALFTFGGEIYTIYEANGAGVNPAPVAHKFDSNLRPSALISFPNIEYRITDVTKPNEEGLFWAINYFYPGDTKLAVDQDPIFENFGKGVTHINYQMVERLLQLRINTEGISLTKSPPIQLMLLGEKSARNWEGIVQLENKGFLIVTDKYPRTILGFVGLP